MKLSITLFFFSFLFLNSSFGQTPPPPKEDQIFKVVDELPTFPGCEHHSDRNFIKKCATEKMVEYLYTNLKYPAIARENGVEGTVVVQFIVEKDGSISNAKVTRDIGAACGDEALRLVNNMPNWNPALRRNNPVRSEYNVPVKFKIDSERTEVVQEKPQTKYDDNAHITMSKEVDDRVESLPNASRKPPPPPPPIRSQIFRVVEQMPKFPGCEEIEDKRDANTCATKNMLTFIYENLQYPAEARKNEVEGISVVTFIVEKDGVLTDAKILRSLGSGTDEEVLRIVNAMPNWNPGKQRGKNVRVQFNMPVRFRL